MSKEVPNDRELLQELSRIAQGFERAGDRQGYEETHQEINDLLADMKSGE